MREIGLSAKGAAFIGAWEGYRPTVYADTRGFATIGIGHLLHESPPTQADERLHWTYDFALRELRVDAESNGLDAIRAHIAVPLTRAQVDALCSLAFNCGPGCLAPGHVVTAAVNSKPHRWDLPALRRWHQRVRLALLAWAHPDVLERRRLSEAQLFATGCYRRPLNRYANA